MRLTLYVPGLLLPEAIRGDTAFDLDTPALSLILGRGTAQTLAPDWPAGAFGLVPPLPAAALRRLGAGETADGDWLCLDPVSLHVGREGILLDDPARLDLSKEESAALIAAVRPLFADWGEIAASAPARWEMRLTRRPDLSEHPLPEAIGRNVDPALPGGADGRIWRRLVAEAQTLLHAHPANRAREALGKPTVASLWPWGAGTLPAAAHADFAVVWSADPVVAGLCAQADIPCLMPPDRFAPASGHVLASVDTLARPARTQNALAWREALLALEADWLAPAVAALRKRVGDQLRLVATGVGPHAGGVVYTLRRRDLWRFWRRPRSLAELA